MKNIKDAAIQPTDLYVVGKVIAQRRDGSWGVLDLELADREITALRHNNTGALPAGLKGKTVEIVGYAGNHNTLRVREVKVAKRGTAATVGNWRLAFIDEAAGQAHVAKYPAYAQED